jgi:hypothetical protein
LPWLQSLDSIAVNGRHAIFLAESLVRVEMLRTVRTCELAITLHTLSLVPGRIRPEIDSTLLFRGRDGVLSLDLWKDEHRALRGKLTPIFYTQFVSVLDRLHIGSMTTIQNLDALKHLVSELEGLAGQPAA